MLLVAITQAFRFQSILLRQTLGGWAISGFGTLATGVPLSVTQTNGRPFRLVSPKIDGSRTTANYRNRASATQVPGCG